jgi:hypothetical protein
MAKKIKTSEVKTPKKVTQKIVGGRPPSSRRNTKK